MIFEIFVDSLPQVSILGVEVEGMAITGPEGQMTLVDRHQHTSQQIQTPSRGSGDLDFGLV
jgi:hypothetical protein